MNLRKVLQDNADVLFELASGESLDAAEEELCRCLNDITFDRKELPLSHNMYYIDGDNRAEIDNELIIYCNDPYQVNKHMQFGTHFDFAFTFAYTNYSFMQLVKMIECCTNVIIKLFHNSIYKVLRAIGISDIVRYVNLYDLDFRTKQCFPMFAIWLQVVSDDEIPILFSPFENRIYLLSVKNTNINDEIAIYYLPYNTIDATFIRKIILILEEIIGRKISLNEYSTDLSEQSLASSSHRPFTLVKKIAFYNINHTSSGIRIFECVDKNSRLFTFAQYTCLYKSNISRLLQPFSHKTLAHYLMRYNPYRYISYFNHNVYHGFADNLLIQCNIANKYLYDLCKYINRRFWIKFKKEEYNLRQMFEMNDLNFDLNFICISGCGAFINNSEHIDIELEVFVKTPFLRRIATVTCSNNHNGYTVMTCNFDGDDINEFDINATNVNNIQYILYKLSNWISNLFAHDDNVKLMIELFRRWFFTQLRSSDSYMSQRRYVINKYLSCVEEAPNMNLKAGAIKRSMNGLTFEKIGNIDNYVTAYNYYNSNSSLTCSKFMSIKI